MSRVECRTVASLGRDGSLGSFLAVPIAMLRDRLDKLQGDFLRVALFFDDERGVGTAILYAPSDAGLMEEARISYTR